MYLLDTNICIELLAGDSRVVEQMASLKRVRVYASAITFGELAYGAMRSARPEYEIAQVKRLMHHVVMLPVDLRASLEYGTLKSQLGSRGELLEDNDLFIAAAALSRGLTLVTHDRAFARVPNLNIEDWLG